MLSSESDDSSSADSEIDGGLRSVVLALADAMVGAETVEAFFSAVSLLASANDLVNGKVPSGRVTKGELELDHIDDI